MAIDMAEQTVEPEYALVIGGEPTLDWQWLSAINGGLSLEGIKPPFDLMDENNVPKPQLNPSQLQQMADSLRQHRDRIINWATFKAPHEGLTRQEDAELMNRFVYSAFRLLQNAATRALGARVMKVTADQIDITRP